MVFSPKKIVFGILIFLVLLNILAWTAVFDLENSADLEVNFFDVGQGDAIFIETPNHQVLIDGGPDANILSKLNIAMPLGDRTIDLVILTHPEDDHLAGLIEVLESYEVENILWTGAKKDTAEFQEWQSLILTENAQEFIAQKGQRVILPGKQTDAVLEILLPSESLANQEIKNINDTSLVSRLSFQNNSFLFTGDISKSIEEQITVSSDVLKVAHHGSKTSTSEEFIKRVNPKTAIISVGVDNNFGHPHKEVLAILEKFAIKVLRTDQVGDIKIISDGNNLKSN